MNDLPAVGNDLSTMRATGEAQLILRHRRREPGGRERDQGCANPHCG